MFEIFNSLLASGAEGPSLTHIVVKLVFQIAVIMLVAKLAGEFTERFLKQPSVLGELVIGVIISPFLLGPYIQIPGFGPLFPVEGHGYVPVSSELYSFAQIAVILLLFMAGLETDLKLFLRYAFPAFVVGLGGVIFSFAFGQVTTVWMGFADSYMHPSALFMGAILTATSVGITARILSEMRKLNTPEGITILGAAVVDDVLGLIVLSLVIVLAEAQMGEGSVSWGHLGLVSLKAFGYWVVLLAVWIFLAKPVVWLLKKFRSEGAWAVLILAICFFFAALSEVFGLAMIVGAYAVGLAFSQTDIAEELTERLSGFYQAVVPVFFVVTGMMVNIFAFKDVLLFGTIITMLAIISKVLGCGLPAMSVGFNVMGGARIGFGMLPRGEVALIIASMGLARGIIPQSIYGVAILTTLVTTLMAPIFLVPLFKSERKGTWKKA
ncbi:MAG: cation:proton antiporter [candidate division WOR-3 bacterium]